MVSTVPVSKNRPIPRAKTGAYGTCSALHEGPSWGCPYFRGVLLEGGLSIESPCVSLCHIDPETGMCEGCGRTLDEIRAWKLADDDQKSDILTRLDSRKSGEAG